MALVKYNPLRKNEKKHTYRNKENYLIFWHFVEIKLKKQRKLFHFLHFVQINIFPSFYT